MAKRKKGRKRAAKPVPKCKAFLLCEQTIVEARTGNISLINTFAGFMLSQLPGRIRRCEAFLQLVDGIGRYDITVEIHDLRQNSVIAKSPTIEIKFGERPNRANLLIPIPPLELSHDGVYDVVVLGNGQEIERQQFEAITPEKPNEPESGEAK